MLSASARGQEGPAPRAHTESRNRVSTASPYLRGGPTENLTWTAAVSVATRARVNAGQRQRTVGCNKGTDSTRSSDGTDSRNNKGTQTAVGGSTLRVHVPSVGRF